MIEEIFGQVMSHRVAVYVPSTVNVSQVLDSQTAERAVEDAVRLLAGLFGGATVLPAQGGWLAQSGELVTEKVTIVYAFASELSREKLEAFKAFALELKERLSQEAIGVEIDHDFAVL